MGCSCRSEIACLIVDRVVFCLRNASLHPLCGPIPSSSTTWVWKTLRKQVLVHELLSTCGSLRQFRTTAAQASNARTDRLSEQVCHERNWGRLTRSDLASFVLQYGRGKLVLVTAEKGCSSTFVVFRCCFRVCRSTLRVVLVGGAVAKLSTT